MERKQFNFYQLIPPLVILMVLGYAIFSNNIIGAIFTSLKTVLMAFAIVYLLNPIVKFIERKSPFNKGFSIIITLILCFAFVALAIASLVPPLTQSVASFIEAAKDPNLVDSVMGKLPKFIMPLLQDVNFDQIYEGVYNVIINYSSTLMNNVKNIAMTAGSMVSFIFSLLLAIFMAYYALNDSDKMSGYAKRLIYAAMKKTHADYFMKTCRLTDKAVKDFLVGKVITCLILGTMTWGSIVLVNLLVPGIDIPYAPLIGFIIGITNIIPYVGPVFGTIPCLLICLFSGVQESIVFLAIVLITQQIDNIYVGPKILGDSLGVSPFWVVASVAIGGSLFGGIGMIISVPIVAVMQQLLYEFIVNKESHEVVAETLARDGGTASNTTTVTTSTHTNQQNKGQHTTKGHHTTKRNKKSKK